MKPHDRPTLGELAGCAAECRHCGCRDFRVISTWVVVNGYRRRQKVCRNCGRDVIYTEQPPERPYRPPERNT